MLVERLSLKHWRHLECDLRAYALQRETITRQTDTVVGSRCTEWVRVFEWARVLSTTSLVGARGTHLGRFKVLELHLWPLHLAPAELCFRRDAVHTEVVHGPAPGCVMQDATITLV